jgi:hypothetical protein
LILNRDLTLIFKLYQQSQGKQWSQLEDRIDTAGTTTRDPEDFAVSVEEEPTTSSNARLPFNVAL